MDRLTVSAKTIRDFLLNSHRRRHWRAEPESWFSPRRIDIVAISPGGRDVVAYEIKVSVADFRNELRDTDKRLTVMRNCTQFYFVVPHGMVESKHIPDGCGLIYFDTDCAEVVIAAPLKKDELPFESDLREYLEADDRDMAMQEFSYLLDINRDPNITLEQSDGCQLPNWMRPRTLWRARKIQFDLELACKSACPAADVVGVIDFSDLPFSTTLEGDR